MTQYNKKHSKKQSTDVLGNQNLTLTRSFTLLLGPNESKPLTKKKVDPCLGGICYFNCEPSSEVIGIFFPSDSLSFVNYLSHRCNSVQLLNFLIMHLLWGLF